MGIEVGKKYVFHFDGTKPDCDEEMTKNYKEIYNRTVCTVTRDNGDGYYDVVFSDTSEGNAFEHELEDYDNYVDRWYEHMRELVKQLYPWYNIDKIKPWGVYVWTKDSVGKYDGENVFDIYANEVAMYNEEHVIPAEAWPHIKHIQDWIKEW